MAVLTISGVHKSFGSVKVLDDINLDVKSGEFIALVGPSGCGKSTLLAIIAGLEKASAGTISIGDRVVNMQSTTYRSFGPFLKESEPEAQIAAQPAVMKRPVIRDGATWYLGWEPETEAKLTT